MDALSQSYWCLSNWNLKVWVEERPVLTVPRVRTRRRVASQTRGQVVRALA